MADDLIPYDASSTDGDEIVPPGEAAALKIVADALTAKVRAAARSGQAPRDAHPKSHGCVEAEFKVLEALPGPYAVGLFAAPQTYQAYIRFSNGSPTPQPDSASDVRGMAIKVMGVAGSRSTTQDFLLINGPAFFVRSAADYIAFTTADPQWRFFVPSWNPFRIRLREFLNVRAMLRGRPSTPLALRYWSTVPYLFGAGAFKYSARPNGEFVPRFDSTSPDFLRANLERHLAIANASFDFMVQRRGNPQTMPIEDSTTEWRENEAPFVTVARITIPPQRFDTLEQRTFGENLSFTPWHGLPEHRPLGGINRMRRTVYTTISVLRHELNHAARRSRRSFETKVPARLVEEGRRPLRSP